MKNIYIKLSDELRKNRYLALATIVETKGSTPQIPGASALFSPDGLYSGTIGGGGLEADAQKRAFQSLQKKQSYLYRYQLTADISSSEKPVCGGEVTILIDACPDNHGEIFENIRKSLESRQPGVLATFIQMNSEEESSIKRHWIRIENDSIIDSEMPYASFHGEIKKSFIENEPDLLELNEKTFLFLEPVYPLPHLVIAGAGHIGQAVCHLGSLLDFEVTVIDDRPEFANKEKLPEADNIIVDDIGKGVQAIPKSSDTYIVIVTRGHKNDADALRHCIDSKVAYIGMIGSKRKIKLIQERSLKEGWATPAQWSRVYAPIGIEIQSKTVQEIAVSIAAQLVLIRRQKHNRRDVIWSGP